MVATDAGAIATAAEKAGIRAVLTRSDHVSGSDRVHEAADIVHSDMGWNAIARFARELRMEDAVVEACRKNLLVWEMYLNGIAAAEGSNTWDPVSVRETLTATTITFNLAPGKALGDAVQVIEPAASGGWVPVGGGVSYPRRTSWVTAMATLADGTVAFGGYFAKAGALDAPNLAVWDPITRRYSTIGAGLAIEPDALASSAFGTLYAATRVRSTAPGGSGGRTVCRKHHDGDGRPPARAAACNQEKA